MELKEYRKDYQYFSGKLGDNSRKLAFAGIAVVWIFKQGESGAYVIPPILKTAMLLFVSTLSFDLLQYIYQTTTWGIYHRYNERKFKGKEDIKLLAPYFLNWPSNFLFWSKVVCLVGGYFVILKFLW